MSLKNESRAQAIRNIQLKNYDVLLVSPVEGDTQTIIVTPSKKSELVSFHFIKVGAHWKIEWRQGASDVLDLFKQRVDPNRFHSKSVFQIHGQVFNMESAFATSEVKQSTDNAWINIKFYPFAFQDRDIEFLKYNSGPTVKDNVKPTAIASSIKYEVIRLDIQRDLKNNITAFSLGWNYQEGENKGSKVISPPVNSTGIKKFIVSDKSVTLIAKGNSLNGATENWQVNIIDLPLLKRWREK
jgi:hypothetical protein